MKGDFSKNIFDAKKHFHDVLMQQGRVLLDSDWNGQAGITAYRTETGTQDIVGVSGAPMHMAGFEIYPVSSLGTPPIADANIMIGKGHFYIDGILCENEENVFFAQQPDYDATALPTDPGTYIFYLDLWLRHITALEDAGIREVALGGPDTTTRTKTLWQVKYIKGTATDTCLTGLPSTILNPSTGKLSARAEITPSSDNPCGTVTSGGYKRLENQLYRVEIHTAGDRTIATYKYSRDNGSVLVKWEGQDSADKNKLIVSSTGRDELLGFKGGNWIELIDDSTDLLGKPGILAELSKVEGNILTIKPGSIKDPANPGATFVTIGTKNPRIRRWDSAGDLALNSNNTTWLTLEEGVEVKFEQGSFQTGDYWMIPARTATADIEWPFVQPQLPQGIKHHFAKLGILDLNPASSAGAKPVWSRRSDCRHIFPPLTELISLFYLGGDGQEARPGMPLANTLQVGVANGQWPVKNAQVKFELLNGGGSIQPVNAVNGIITTTANGIASCNWTMGTGGLQQVKATLLDAAGNEVHLPVIFNAKLTPPAMFYVSGDGQEAMPGKLLANLLVVGVAYEQFPVPGAKVKFTIESGGGTINQLSPLTNADGLVQCKWTLGNSGAQQVKAILLDASNMPLHIPIIFTAGLSVASDILYDGTGCDNWGNLPHNTVAEAITALCKRSSKGCSVTVGKEGKYQTMEEAFKALKEESDVCICLLPQEEDHLIKPLITDRKQTIKITGCGANVLMAGEVFSLSAGKIILQGFSLETSKELKDPRITFTAGETNIDHCSFINNTGSKGPFIQVLPVKQKNEAMGSAILNCNDSRIVSLTALALNRGVYGWINDNIIEGTVLLQYENEFVALTWKPVQEPERAVIEKKLPQQLVIVSNDTSREVLQIQGNTLEKVTTNNLGKINIPAVFLADDKNNQKAKSPVPKKVLLNERVMLPGYKNLIISGNVFTQAGSSFVAEFVNINNNHFTVEAETATVLAYALAHRGVVTGNIDKTYNGDGGAGYVDTFFDPNQKIKSPNLLVVK